MLFQFPYGRTAFAGDAVAPAVGKHKVFISFYHKDQRYKDALVAWGESHGLFVDKSVNIGDIPEHWGDEQIRIEIRDDYLQDSTVTIVPIGAETKNRKHVDRGIHSSMHDGRVNKRSGILAVNSPAMAGGDATQVFAARGGEKESVYPEIRDWASVNSRREWER